MQDHAEQLISDFESDTSVRGGRSALDGDEELDLTTDLFADFVAYHAGSSSAGTSRYRPPSRS